MHASSYKKMVKFKNLFLDDKQNLKLTILDLGSRDINGNYKDIFLNDNWNYIGVDTAAGKNVDIIIKDIYNWSEFEDNSIDVVISGQTFEHIEFFWLTIKEISRVLKPDGLCCIIAPSAGVEHKYPLDCWRFYSDGMKALAKWADLKIIIAATQKKVEINADVKDIWKDSVLIAVKKYKGNIDYSEQIKTFLEGFYSNEKENNNLSKNTIIKNKINYLIRYFSKLIIRKK